MQWQMWLNDAEPGCDVLHANVDLSQGIARCGIDNRVCAFVNDGLDDPECLYELNGNILHTCVSH